MQAAQDPDRSACLKGLAYTLWAFIMVTLVLEGLEFANIVYKGREGIEMIMEYVTGPLLDSVLRPAVRHRGR